MAERSFADDVSVSEWIQIVRIALIATPRKTSQVTPAVGLHQLNGKSLFAIDICDGFVNDIDGDPLIRHFSITSSRARNPLPTRVLE